MTATSAPITRDDLRATLDDILARQKVLDIHTHLFAPAFGDLLLYGVDELLTYHYLIAEVFRKSELAYSRFWDMSKTEQADLIWKTLFLDNSPVSEACRGVVTTLQALGLDLSTRDLNAYRQELGRYSAKEYVDKVFELANLREVIMTNDPFDVAEHRVWLTEEAHDPRFQPALRIDVLLNQYHERAAGDLRTDGYQVDRKLNDTALEEIRRFLTDWIERMNPRYMAVSLPPDFVYPEDSPRGRIIEEAILPVSLEHNVPFALMIGVTRAVNPELKLAGDGVGKADLKSLENLLRDNPHNKFLVTLLSRENQHELCVLARKFRNMMVFGCWWFLNNPSIIEEMSRERLELLGLSMIPQHSDARILDQVIYKWKHSKKIIGDVLADKYTDLLDAGWTVTRNELERDVHNLFGGNFERFLEMRF